MGQPGHQLSSAPQSCNAVPSARRDDHILQKVEELIDWLADDKVGRLYVAVLVVALYFAFQTATLSLLGLWAGNGVNIDDAEQLIYLPHLAAGYGGSQPPLYNWIAWTISQGFGTSIVSLKLVRYVLLFVGFAASHAAMRKLGYKQVTAAAAMFGLMTVPLLFWEAQHSLTHSVAAFAFCAVTLLAFAHLVHVRTPLAYASFGLAAALATLAKFNDVLMLGALLPAAMTVRAYRPTLVSPWILLSMAVFVLVLTPTTVWSYYHSDAIFARISKFGIADDDDGMIGIRGEGLFKIIYATASFSIVTLVIYVLGFVWKRSFPRRQDAFNAPRDKLLERALLIGLLAVLLLVLASGSTSLRNRWLLPVLFLLPLYLAARMEKLGAFGREVQRFVIALAVVTALLVTPFTWYAQLMGGEGKSRTARLDFKELYHDLQATGPVRTILGNSSWVGNFRLAEGDLVLLNPEVPELKELFQDPAVLMWLDENQPDPALVEILRQADYELSSQTGTLVGKELFGSVSGRRIYFARLHKRGSAGASVQD
ncbi:glycosyl transferase family 39 [Mesorhizobium sp. M6A.T.Ce.TU.016.01.1.1]|nr:glycosyl transferase family 39 [Mesorhizobium sp. M6A.T.Ce.TU.016.01.1.1]